MEGIEIAFRGAQGGTLQKRLCAVIRREVLAGGLHSGQKLPPSRVLAEELGISRTTVVCAYDQLIAEGYLEPRTGAGTYVSLQLIQKPDKDNAAGESAPPLLSVAGKRCVTLELLDSMTANAPAEYDFLPGTPDWSEFPRQLWRRIYNDFLFNKGHELSRYSDPAGVPALREALALYLAQRRGVHTPPGRIVIVNGTQQALHLLCRICLNPGDAAAIEEPGFPGIQQNLEGLEAKIVPLAVDHEGLSMDGLENPAQIPRIVYVTPSHQYPTGVTLALERRLSLLDWAASRGSLIVEDDYDSELRYDAAPIPSLYSLDRHSTVVYIGSFSDVLLPPLRVGYVVLPAQLVKPFVCAKWLADRQTPTLEQHVLARLLREGEFERHLRRIKRVYRYRRDVMVHMLRQNLGSSYVITGETTGLFITLWLPRDIDEQSVMDECAARGVRVYPLSTHYLGSEKKGGFVLGYGSMPEAQLQAGLGQLIEVLKDWGRRRPGNAGFRARSTGMEEP